MFNNPSPTCFLEKNVTLIFPFSSDHEAHHMHKPPRYCPHVRAAFSAFVLLLFLSPLISAYKPSTGTKATIDPATRAPSRNRATPTTPVRNSKPNPLATLFEVYTRGSGDNAGVASDSPEEIRLRKERQYTLITGLPLKPYFERRTVRRQIAKDIWTFEQPQGFFNVTTPIRMTVIRLSDGRLWVHAPVAATAECRRLVDELGGQVAYIVLPTTAFEHKVFVGGFARAYPAAKVYACPGQWSWPINLPPPFRVDAYLTDPRASSDGNKGKGGGTAQTPWANEIEHMVFEPPCIGIGPANEVVFLHKASRTLLVTDLVVYIDGDSPSPVVEVPDLLKASWDDPDAVPPGAPLPPDTPANRRKGWARMALQILFLGPTRFSTFKLVQRRLLVSPVIETFVYSKIPDALVDFVDRIATTWDFTTVLPAHFNAPAPGSPTALQDAFAFAYRLTGRRPSPARRMAGGTEGRGSNPFLALWDKVMEGAREGKRTEEYPEDDTAVLRFVNGFILKAGIANK